MDSTIRYTTVDTTSPQVITSHLSDCEDILQKYDLSYSVEGLFLQVGAIESASPWTLHISVIRVQFTALLNKVLPSIIDANVNFQIPKNKSQIKKLLDGDYGSQHIGKIVSIRSQDINTLVQLAKKLIPLTSEFKGPAVHSSACLGGCIYAQLADPNQSANWPFIEIIPQPRFKTKLLLKDKYKILSVIKPDNKGSVFQANYFKGIFKIQMCIIKEGIKNMWADEHERDIVDRIKWQYAVYKHLEGSISSPKIFDYFEENGNVYLTLDFIKGNSLEKQINSVYSNESWSGLTLSQKTQLIDYLLSLIAQIDTLHAKGYVHRDITPGNFIVDKTNCIHLIDMELAYSLTQEIPSPPFKLGTPGFMSPEQIARLTPTIKEDIYAIGALMVHAFSGISPVKFDFKDDSATSDRLAHFIDYPQLVNLIKKCLSSEAENRPELFQIKAILLSYKSKLLKRTVISKPRINTLPSSSDLDSIIKKGLNGLISTKVKSDQGLWISPQASRIQPTSNDRTPQLGFHTGIAGILLLIAKATRLGLTNDSISTAYKLNLNFLQENIFLVKHDFGYCNGTSGIAAALHEGILSGLLKCEDSKTLDAYFPTATTHDLSFASGLAGQGMALLKCQAYLSKSLLDKRLSDIVGMLLSHQQKGGDWNLLSGGKRQETPLGLFNGISGILCFLISYCESHDNGPALTSLTKGLNWLMHRLKGPNKIARWYLPAKVNSINKISTSSGLPGIGLTFIRAYELLGDLQYKRAGEDALRMIPIQVTYNDFTQAEGISGLGEIYLEGCRILKTEEWNDRSNWIAKTLFHTFILEEKYSGYWSINPNTNHSSDLLSGVSGILHYLMRVQYPTLLEHILINSN